MAAVSSSEDKLATVLISAILLRRRQRKHPKRFWIRPIFTRRQQQGEYYNLLQEMRLSDEESHFKYMWMSKERFDVLLSQVNEHSYIRSMYVQYIY